MIARSVGECFLFPWQFPSETGEEIGDSANRADCGAIYSSEKESDKEPHNCGSYRNSNHREDNLSFFRNNGHGMGMGANAEISHRSHKEKNGQKNPENSDLLHMPGLRINACPASSAVREALPAAVFASLRDGP